MSREVCRLELLYGNRLRTTAVAHLFVVLFFHVFLILDRYYTKENFVLDILLFSICKMNIKETSRSCL